VIEHVIGGDERQPRALGQSREMMQPLRVVAAIEVLRGEMRAIGEIGGEAGEEVSEICFTAVPAKAGTQGGARKSPGFPACAGKAANLREFSGPAVSSHDPFLRPRPPFRRRPPDGPTARLAEGLTWGKLAGMSPAERVENMGRASLGFNTVLNRSLKLKTEVAHLFIGHFSGDPTNATDTQFGTSFQDVTSLRASLVAIF